jgi:predicted nucleic acid-binding protein
VVGYLLDVNHIAALFRREKRIVEMMQSVPGEQVRACAITLGEILAGHRTTSTTNTLKRDEYITFINHSRPK